MKFKQVACPALFVMYSFFIIIHLTNHDRSLLKQFNKKKSDIYFLKGADRGVEFQWIIRRLADRELWRKRWIGQLKEIKTGILVDNQQQARHLVNISFLGGSKRPELPSQSRNNSVSRVWTVDFQIKRLLTSSRSSDSCKLCRWLFRAN